MLNVETKAQNKVKMKKIEDKPRYKQVTDIPSPTKKQTITTKTIKGMKNITGKLRQESDCG